MLSMDVNQNGFCEIKMKFKFIIDSSNQSRVCEFDVIRIFHAPIMHNWSVLSSFEFAPVIAGKGIIFNTIIFDGFS